MGIDLESSSRELWCLLPAVPVLLILSPPRHPPPPAPQLCLFPFPLPWALLTHWMSRLELGNPGLSESGISQYLPIDFYCTTYYLLSRLVYASWNYEVDSKCKQVGCHEGNQHLGFFFNPEEID